MSLHSIATGPADVANEARTVTIVTATIGLSAMLHCSQREDEALA